MLRFLNKTVGVPLGGGGFPNVAIRATTKTPGSNEDSNNYSRFNGVGAEVSYPVFFGGAGGVVLVVGDADATSVVTVVGGYIPDTTSGGTVLGTVTNPKAAPTASQHIVVPVGIEYVWLSHAGVTGGPVRGLYAIGRQEVNA